MGLAELNGFFLIFRDCLLKIIPKKKWKKVVFSQVEVLNSKPINLASNKSGN